ncbi:serine/arginine repetitive matrix protein 1-like [Hordeum vulgare subsp. vulgare]|uniref:serine/arginine repetitive matrix protein 1-like n=1 Tax=Hordeum vulgare subsp. vulgare TaxID=112509 RepID=UPI001D1A3D0B|nr:serine/arginine repetitive matrix protein 1-like [Hordeum vulgare subsp. vulgare]
MWESRERLSSVTRRDPVDSRQPSSLSLVSRASPNPSREPTSSHLLLAARPAKAHPGPARAGIPSVRCTSCAQQPLPIWFGESELPASASPTGRRRPTPATTTTREGEPRCPAPSTAAAARNCCFHGASSRLKCRAAASRPPPTGSSQIRSGRPRPHRLSRYCPASLPARRKSSPSPHLVPTREQTRGIRGTSPRWPRHPGPPPLCLAWALAQPLA